MCVCVCVHVYVCARACVCDMMLACVATTRKNHDDESAIFTISNQSVYSVGGFFFFCIQNFFK